MNADFGARWHGTAWMGDSVAHWRRRRKMEIGGVPPSGDGGSGAHFSFVSVFGNSGCQNSTEPSIAPETIFRPSSEYCRAVIQFLCPRNTWTSLPENGSH